MIILSDIHKELEISSLPVSTKIFIGKNAKENSELVKRFQNSSGVWFHLKDLPSPHIIILDTENTNSKIILNKQLLIYIGGLMKLHSKKAFACSKNLKMEYTEISNVKTTSTPGLVTLKKSPMIFKI